MKLAGPIASDLFDVFISEGVWLDYAKRFLPPEQIDAVEVSALPGYRPLLPTLFTLNRPSTPEIGLTNRPAGSSNGLPSRRLYRTADSTPVGHRLC